ncbi:MAG: hypothetical protein KAJ88_02415 [Candidatus Aenigmarchaeota archaeon]|nr:hypothetical protein [Candidatus Aenigmarchaeota archaeon]
MAGYKFTPQKGRTATAPHKTYKRDTKGSTPGPEVTAIVRRFKTPMFIAAALLLVIVLIGPSMTGNLLLSSEDKALADSPGFPKLSEFEANKQFYLCQSRLNQDSGKLSQYQRDLEIKSTTMETCLQEKNTLSSQYSSCTSDLSSCETSLTSCSSSKESLSAEVELCTNDLIIKKQDLSDLELESYAVKINYANSYCCIKRTIDANPDIKYYRFENNRIICTTDNDYEEFDWDDC